MTRTRIKICGIKEPDDALAAADAGASWIGLVFVKESPRYVSVAQARAIADALPPSVTPVGLFANHRADEVNRITTEVGLDTVQLHGREPSRILDKLKNLNVIRAMAFGGKTFANYVEWDNDDRVHFLLLDSPPVDGLSGGSGEVFDWKALAARRTSFYSPFFLAGGLTPDNVAEAIDVVRPFAVDVSSGVESSRGVKDVGLIEAFCEAVN